MSENPIIGFQLDPADVQYIGQNLQRLECILAEPDGTLWSADSRGVSSGFLPTGLRSTPMVICGEPESPISNPRWPDCQWYTGI